MSEQHNRRSILKGAPAALLAGFAAPAMVNATTTGDDALVALVDEWKAAFHAWIAEAAKPGGGNFDTPACIKWETEKRRLENCIRRTPPISPQGVTALLDFLWLDNSAEFVDENYIDIQKWAFQHIADFAQGAAV